MKNVFLMAALLICVQAFSQNFEGTIKWSMKADITDPATKAQMAQAQQQMSDPATQAKMKEAMEKMNDPQMKAMMESNPQLKAQMEKMMSSMASGNMNSMVPKGMTIRIKGNNSISQMDGGMFTDEMLYLSDKNTTYSINRKNKTYSAMNAKPTQNTQTQDVEAKVTKTSETMKILNYTCTKYLVETTSHGMTVSQIIWATPDFKGIDTKAFAKQRASHGQNIFYDKIDGMPLRVESKVQQMNMVMEVTEITPGSLSASDFTIPSDYKEVQGGMMR